MSNPKNNDKKAAFGRFWKKQGVNEIIALVFTMAIILFLSVGNYIRFGWPVWVVLVLLFWGGRMWYRFHTFLRDEKENAEKENK